MCHYYDTWDPISKKEGKKGGGERAFKNRVMEVVCSLQLKEKPVVKKKFCLPNGSTVVVGTIRTTERSGNSKLVPKKFGWKGNSNE